MKRGPADRNVDANRVGKCNHTCRVTRADTFAERRLLRPGRAGIVVLVFGRPRLGRARVQPLDGAPGNAGSE